MNWGWVWIALGGAAGAVCRVGVSTLVQRRVSVAFPAGTLVVNVAGCLLLGLAAGLMDTRFKAQPELRLAVTAGFLGAFTTFSTFAYETVDLWRNGWMLRAVLYVSASIAAGCVGLWIAGKLTARI